MDKENGGADTRLDAREEIFRIQNHWPFSRCRYWYHAIRLHWISIDTSDAKTTIAGDS